MKLPIVSIDQGKILKLLGFDWPVHGSYTEYLKTKRNQQDGTSGPFGWKAGEVTFDPDYFSPENDMSNSSWIQVPAPTVALAIKWIRETYDIHIGVFPEFEMGVYYVPYMWPREVELTTKKDMWAATFEECESKALDFILDYIVKKAIRK